MTAESPTISALFLTIFDDHKGQSLIWSRTNNPDEDLKGIEFLSLPSGLHLVSTDTFYLARGDQLGVTVFSNRELSGEEVREAGVGVGVRGRRMMSLGVLMNNQSPTSHSFPPLSTLRTLLSTLSSSSTIFDASLSPTHPVYVPLEAFWEDHKGVFVAGSKRVKGKGKERELGEVLSLGYGIPSDHPIYYLPTLLESFGPKICTLRKYASEGRRIMFFSLPPLFPPSQAAWCVWALGQSARGRKRRGEFAFLGCLGLMELGSLEGREGGWVACTSDAIFKDRPNMYDLLIDLSDIHLPLLSTSGPSPIPLASPPLISSIIKASSKSKSRVSASDVTTKTISYAFSDLPVYRQLRAASTSFASLTTPPPRPGLERTPTASSVFSTTSRVVSATWLWLLAYGAYETVCEVCWGVCSLASGRFYLRSGEEHKHGHGSGRIRLDDDDDEGLLDGGEEEEEGLLVDEREDEAEAAGRRERSALRRSLAILHVFQQLDGEAPLAMANGEDSSSSLEEEVPAAPKKNQKISLGLERMETLMRQLPPMTIPTIHIAGTNGKGSVSAMLTSALVGAGLRTGTFNSPHLVTVTDSILLSGVEVRAEVYARCERQVEKMGRKAGLDCTPFELLTATAFLIFSASQPPLDILIIECGMGGLRDSTNVLPASNQLCAVLTPVDLDHQGFLGNTVEAIATEKMGILAREGVLVVGKQGDEGVRGLAEGLGRGKGAAVVMVGEVEVVQGKREERRKGAWNVPKRTMVKITLPAVEGGNELIDFSEGSVEVESPLPGAHQLDNLATVMTVLHLLSNHPRCLRILPRLAKMAMSDLKAGLAKTEWRGRCSWVDVANPSRAGTRMKVLVDGAHNTAAARTLRSYIDTLDLGKTIITYIVGLSHSPPKTAEDVLTPLIRKGDRVVITPFSLPVEGMPWIKSVDGELVKAAVRSCGLKEGDVEEAGSLVEALGKATAGWAEGEERLVIVTGSLYLVADLYRLAAA